MQMFLKKYNFLSVVLKVSFTKHFINKFKSFVFCSSNVQKKFLFSLQKYVIVILVCNLKKHNYSKIYDIHNRQWLHDITFMRNGHNIGNICVTFDVYKCTFIIHDTDIMQVSLLC